MTLARKQDVAIDTAELWRQLESVQAKLDKALEDLADARAGFAAAAHVIVLAGVDAELLRRCGCTNCERIFEALSEAEIIREPWKG